MSSIHRNAVADPRPRSYLYAPGDNAAILAKALDSEADVVVADLEDAVPEDRKELARANVLAALRAGPDKPLHVRVPADEPGGEADLRALAGSGVQLVRLAKVRGGEDVRRAAAILAAAQAPADLRLSCLIESAIGVERAHEIAIADPRVAAISLGESDLRSDLGVTDDRGLLYARSRIVVAARAAGLTAPVQSVYTDVGDLDGLRASCLEGRGLGFRGRSVVHPRQIAVVHEAYALSAAERDRARAIADHADRVQRDGVLLLDDGRLVDAATVAEARAILEPQG
jgi:citrate lyase subunit beta / citryl-CoA lyase